MRQMLCKKCGRSISMIPDVNCRLNDYSVTYDDYHIEVICNLDVYCAACGRINNYCVQRYFSKNVFCGLSDTDFIRMTIYDSLFHVEVE